MDFMALAIAFGFFAGSWGLVALCERLRSQGSMSAITLLAGGVAVALLGYLVVALLTPEKLG